MKENSNVGRKRRKEADSTGMNESNWPGNQDDRQPFPSRGSIVQQVADWLRAHIHAGSFDGPLPSHRALQTQLQVGRSTIEAAFKILRNEGTIHSEARKRALSLANNGTVTRDKVCWLDWDWKQNYSSCRLRNILFFQTMLKGHGYDFEFRISNRMFFRHRVRNRISLFKDPRVLCWLLVNQPPEIQQQAHDAKLPAIVMGARTPTVNLPWIDLCWRGIARHVGGAALAKGHRRIVFFCSRGQTVDHEECIQGICDAFQPHVDDRKFSLKVIRHDETRRGIISAARKLWLEERPKPTVLVVKEAYAALTIFSTLLSFFQLRFPKDCSIVCLEDDDALHRMMPEISRYAFGTQVIWRQLISTVQRLPRLDGSYRFEIQPHPVQGDTFEGPREETDDIIL